MGSIRYEFEDFGPELDALRERERCRDRISRLRWEKETKEQELRDITAELNTLQSSDVGDKNE